MKKNLKVFTLYVIKFGIKTFDLWSFQILYNIFYTYFRVFPNIKSSLLKFFLVFENYIWMEYPVAVINPRRFKRKEKTAERKYCWLPEEYEVLYFVLSNGHLILMPNHRCHFPNMWSVCLSFWFGQFFCLVDWSQNADFWIHFLSYLFDYIQTKLDCTVFVPPDFIALQRFFNDL